MLIHHAEALLLLHEEPAERAIFTSWRLAMLAVFGTMYATSFLRAPRTTRGETPRGGRQEPPEEPR